MSETINNHLFDLAYEDYKAYVNGLQTVYHRLIWNFPNHEMVKFWGIRQEHWRNYKKLSQGYKAFNSIEELEEEIYKIVPEYFLSKALEKELICNQKGSMSETEYLLSTKANTESLARSIKEAEDGTGLIDFDPTK